MKTEGWLCSLCKSTPTPTLSLTVLLPFTTTQHHYPAIHPLTILSSNSKPSPNHYYHLPHTQLPADASCVCSPSAGTNLQAPVDPWALPRLRFYSLTSPSPPLLSTLMMWRLWANLLSEQSILPAEWFSGSPVWAAAAILVFNIFIVSFLLFQLLSNLFTNTLTSTSPADILASLFSTATAFLFNKTAHQQAVRYFPVHYKEVPNNINSNCESKYKQ